jgi:myosin-5
MHRRRGIINSITYYNDIIKLKDVSDEEIFERTKIAMDVVGISKGRIFAFFENITKLFHKDDQENIFGLLSAILWIGNLKFVDGKEVDSSELEDSTILQTACKLLGCSEESLRKYLIK